MQSNGFQGNRLDMSNDRVQKAARTAGQYRTTSNIRGGRLPAQGKQRDSPMKAEFTMKSMLMTEDMEFQVDVLFNNQGDMVLTAN